MLLRLRRNTRLEKRTNLRFIVDFHLLICCHGTHPNFLDKILLRSAGSSFSSSKFFTIVLGGTAALHAYRVWGAVIFWGRNPLVLLALARAHARARLKPQ
ncbi:MAG: hypothetical protein DME48_06500 [Verrucomicrobia bacterium]|nr:MAG: hypothetical protein DME48_06500 [Verrucomicrobiota bacterium]